MMLKKKHFKKIAGKAQNAGNPHVFLFLQYLSPAKDKFLCLVYTTDDKFILSSENAFNLDSSKVLSFGKGIRTECTRPAMILIHLFNPLPDDKF